MPKYKAKINLTLKTSQPYQFLNMQILEDDIKKNLTLLIKHHWHDAEIEKIKVNVEISW